MPAQQKAGAVSGKHLEPSKCLQLYINMYLSKTIAISTLFVLFFNSSLKCQNVYNISVRLKTIATDTSRADNSFYISTNKYDNTNINYDSSLHIFGVPQSIRNYIIKTLDFQPEQGIYELYLRYRGSMDANSLQKGLSLVSRDATINDTVKLSNHFIKHVVLFLVGENKEGKNVVIADANNNHDFSDDKIIIVDSSNKNNDENIAVRYQYAYNANILTRTIQLRMSTIHQAFRYSDSLEQKFYLIVYVNEYKSGHLLVKNSSYQFKVINTEAPFISFQKNINLYINNNKDNIYTIGDSIYLKKEKFVIKSYSYFGDSIYLQHVEPGKLMYGKYPGQYAYNIKKNDILNVPFDLSTYKGKYVLLDFWGSWCLPCIASIPDLVAFSKKYTTHLQVVSIAEDEPDKINTIKSLIAAKEMKWIHLFENMNEESKSKISSRYSIQSYPTQILIDPEGKIVFRNFNGARLTEEILDSMINFK